MKKLAEPLRTYTIAAMSSTFTGFSEEDLKIIKSGESGSNIGNDLKVDTSNMKKIDKLGARSKRATNQYKLPILQKQDSDEAMENMFDKCKLSIKTPTSPVHDIINNNENCDSIHGNSDDNSDEDELSNVEINEPENLSFKKIEGQTSTTLDDRSSSEVAPDVVRCADNYTEDELAAHRARREELQLQQKLIEEQNKKRKEMLAKALADRTKQTEEEVVRLEKIKKELQVLDGQFTQDVAVLRKKIDHASLSYADAEKCYLRIEKEFLQAKIHLQKEKEKKELLTEHLCALITHNETRKAQKLETLMLELATDRKLEAVRTDVSVIEDAEDGKPVIVDGVDEKTGKIVEFTNS